MNLYTIALVGLGGFLGAVLRFLVYEMSFKISSFLANATNMQFVSLLATLFVNHRFFCFGIFVCLCPK